MFALQSENIIFTKIRFRLMQEYIEPPPRGTKLTVKPELTYLFFFLCLQQWEIRTK